MKGGGSMKTAFIIDVDGTLADVREIRHLVMGRVKNFDKFHAESVNVPAHLHVIDMARKAKEAGHDVLIVTARNSKYRHQTAFWLALNGVPSDALFMRKDGDFRKDYFVKKDILEVIKQSWNVVHAIDDNPAIIKLWEENNIPTTIIEGWDNA
jgi:FMN phosphatase YigB (HAD superfamily)